jgi:hypothetical protein
MLWHLCERRIAPTLSAYGRQRQPVIGRASNRASSAATALYAGRAVR